LGVLAGASNTSESPVLTPQEERLMDLVVKGCTNKEISSSLNLAEGTVQNYLTSVSGKLGVQKRSEATSFWIQRQ